MGMLDLRKLYFRQPLPKHHIDRHAKWRDSCTAHQDTQQIDAERSVRPASMDCGAGDLFNRDPVWTCQTTPASLVWPIHDRRGQIICRTIDDRVRVCYCFSSISRQSPCSLEADAVAEDILNVHQVPTRFLVFSVLHRIYLFSIS